MLTKISDIHRFFHEIDKSLKAQNKVFLLACFEPEENDHIST